MAACMAEHGLTGKVIGVVFDGMGFGLDGSAWGGEFLVGDASKFERGAHLLPVALPGGDRAAHEPWRMAVAHLLAAGVDPRSTPLARRIERRALELVLRMVERGVNSPPTTSAGRLFDAVASLAGVADYTAFEASAAMQLESMAARSAERKGGSYPFSVNEVGERWVVDTRPLILAVAADAKERVAWRFHATLAEIVASVCARLAASHHTDRVVLSGGVFQNAVLSELTVSRLEASGLRAHTHRVLPPNDACLSLGQLAILAGLHS
jgi:hydrogenase maturation protein HypF